MPIHDWTRVNVAVFQHFHHAWIVTIKRSLNGLIPPDHYALIEHNANGLAIATQPPKLPFTAQCEEEAYALNRNRIAIRHRTGDRVVAILEIVSPGNKSSPRALHSFVKKATELLDAGVHLRVIDLFPPSPRDPAGIHAAIWAEIQDNDFQLPEGEPLTLVSYAAGDIKRAFIEPTAVGKTLIEMPLFYEPERYVPVPLEETYQRAFEEVPQRWRAELE